MKLIKSKRKSCFCILFICLSGGGASATTSFNNISASDLRMIVKNFSGVTDYSTVTPASSLGDWGFELGIAGGLTQTPDLQSLNQSAGGSGDLSKLPHAEVYGTLAFPHAITAEIALFPKTGIGDVSFQQFGGALKWTATDEVLQGLPLDLALKIHYSYANAGLSQTIQNASTGNVPVNATAVMANLAYGLDVYASRRFGPLEPYAAFGFVQASGALSITGAANATVFSPSFTTAQSATSSPNSPEWSLGLNVHAGWLALGAEFMRAFDVNTVNGKLAFQF